MLWYKMYIVIPLLITYLSMRELHLGKVNAAVDFEGHNLTCLSHCVSNNPTYYADAWPSLLTTQDICNDLLSRVYSLCNSFDIATARCQPTAACRKQCSISDWCYFGVGMISNCPGDQWHNLTDKASQMNNVCVAAEQELVQSKNMDNTTTDSANNKETWSIIEKLVNGHSLTSIIFIGVTCT